MKDLRDDHDITHLEGALRLFPQREVAIDIGAHRGIWTRRLIQEFGKVIAFEPSELADKVPGVVHKCAIGRDYGTASLKSGKENNGQTHLVTGSDVEVYPLDHFNIHDVSFIKIDVEGMECDVIEGAVDTINAYRPAVMFEENGLCERYGRDWGDAKKLLEQMGYQEAGKWNKDHLMLYVY